jgi:hypothetical protein
VGTRTDAALAEVIAARADLADEIDRLEAAGRAAVDIPAKVRRSPAKAAAITAGGAFLVLGGPKRLYRRARKAITGKEDAPLPKSLLPKEIDKSLKKMGSDGDKVRGTIERDFAKYLDERAKERRKEGIQAAVLGLLVAALKPIGTRAGRQAAERLMNPDDAAFQEQLRRVRERRASILKEKGPGAGEGAGPESGAGI